MQPSANHPKNHFKFALRTLRKAKKLSQEDFGALSSRTYVSSLERGLKSPTLNKVDDLAQIMDVHPLTILALAYAKPDCPNGWQAVLDLVVSELTAVSSELNRQR
jgi:transcriptional regulator with XRE-family HTH domain